MEIRATINDSNIFVEKEVKDKIKKLIKNNHITIGNKKFTIRDIEKEYGI